MGKKLSTATEHPWTERPRQQLAGAWRAGRLPHAVLLVGPPEIGKLELARWLASLVLCSGSEAPCGRCPSCELLAAGNHPDLMVCGLLEDATSISVEQIRGLIETMALKSYLGGSKVAILSPADKMNTSSFNALLKLLEEPPDKSLLILAASRLEALPVTVASRCQRLRLPVPARTAALAWLGAREPGRDWNLALDLAGGVPARALQLAANGVDALYEEVADTVGRGALDVVAVAKRWSDDRTVERLNCLDDWLLTCARQAFHSDAVNNSRRVHLPSSGTLPDIAALVRLIHSTRETRARVDGTSRVSYNVQLLLEALLVRLQSAFG